MPFAVSSASCVLVGTFNIYIVRPDWLGKIGLLPEESEVKIESPLSRPGFKLSSSNLDTSWEVEPNRIVWTPRDPMFDCGSVACEFLKALPWSPISATGFNFVLKGRRADVNDIEMKTQFPPMGKQVLQRTWHVGIKINDHVVNLQMAEIGEAIELRVNVHTDLEGRDLDFTMKTLSSFCELRDQAFGLLSDSFSVEVAGHVQN